MSYFDIALAVIIAVFGLFGLWFGFVHALGAILGTTIGAFLASRYYGVLAGWLISITGWHENVSKVVMFILAFIVINRLVGLVFWFLDRLLSIGLHLPFIRSINHIAGGILGLGEGLLTVGIALYFIERIPYSSLIIAQMSSSIIAPYAIHAASVLVPLLPEALRLLNSSVNYAEQVINNIPR